MTSQPKDLNRCGECGKEKCGSCTQEDRELFGGHAWLCHGHPKEEAKCERCGGLNGKHRKIPVASWSGETKMAVDCPSCSPPHPADQTEKWEEEFSKQYRWGRLEHLEDLIPFIRTLVAEARLEGMKARGHCPSCMMKNAHPFAGGPCRGPQED